MTRYPFARFFLNADTGGGGAAVAEPAPSADAVLADLTDFSAPDLNTLMGDTPEPKPADVKPVEPKPGDKPVEKAPEVKPGDKKPPTEPPAKQLREELERTRKERDEFKSKVENHPRVRELEASIAELTKERDTIKADVDKTRKELDIRDPLASSKLREHQESFDKEYSRSIEFVPEIEGNYQQLVNEFANLPRGDREQYRTALGEFETKLEESVGPRKFAAAMDIIRKGYDFIGQHRELRKEVTENASRLSYEARENEWKKYDGEVSGLLENAFDVPEDLETSDPYNPALFVKRALAEVDESKRNEVVSTIDTFVKRVFAGPKPRSDKDFPGLAPKEIQERIASEMKAHGESKQAAVRMMKQGMLALTMMRPIVAELAKLRERVKKEAEAVPPNPNDGGESTAGNPEDLANFTAPPVRI